MIIAITGAGGFIGKQLAVFFRNENYELRTIQRIVSDTPVADVARQLTGVDVIVNLAGAPIIARWSETYKKNLFDSRIITTTKIVEAIKLLDVKPKLLVSASAVGIYSQEGEHTESNYQVANDFLGKLCVSWESEAKKALPFNRVIIIRLGIVLGKNGGALGRMLPLFKLGLGGKIGTGKQGFSWIHSTDLIQAIQFIIENEQFSGEFNFTAPDVVDNSTFTQQLSKVLKRPAFFTVPAQALKLVFGEGAIAVTGGQFALPEHLLDAGFQFKFPDLASALKDITS
jgi:uncharacterized protein